MALGAVDAVVYEREAQIKRLHIELKSLEEANADMKETMDVVQTREGNLMGRMKIVQDKLRLSEDMNKRFRNDLVSMEAKTQNVIRAISGGPVAAAAVAVAGAEGGPARVADGGVEVIIVADSGNLASYETEKRI